MQGVLHDKLVMIGRVRFRDLNNFVDNYKRRQIKKVAVIVITVGGDVSPDSSYGNLCRELSEPGKERAGLFYGEGVKDSKMETNYELYIVPPSLKSKLTQLHTRENELQDLISASGPHCTTENTFYGIVTYVEGGPDRYVNASEVVTTHARNACQAVVASIAHEVEFEPEEAPTATGSSAATTYQPSHEVQDYSIAASTATATTTTIAAAPTRGAYASTAAAFSANYAADHGATTPQASLPVALPHVPKGTAVAVAPPVDVDVDIDDIGFQPAPADTQSTTGSGVNINPKHTSAPADLHDTTISSSSGSGSGSGVHEGVPRPASPQTAADSQPAAALAMSAEMRELLSKAADHCARSGVKTFKTMQAREAKQRVKTMPFLFPEHPGHDLFKAEVVRREKEIRANKSANRR